MEIPKITQLAFADIVDVNERTGSKWINPILELSQNPEDIERFFRIHLEKANSIYDTINVDLCNVNFYEKSIVILCKIREANMWNIQYSFTDDKTFDETFLDE